MPITNALREGRLKYWERVRKGEIPHPTKGKTFKKKAEVVPSTPAPAARVVPAPKAAVKPVPNGQKLSIPSPLEMLRVATSQLALVDSIPIEQIEKAFGSLGECDRGLMVVDQLIQRLERWRHLINYCKKVHVDILERLRAHRTS